MKLQHTQRTFILQWVISSTIVEMIKSITLLKRYMTVHNEGIKEITCI